MAVLTIVNTANVSTTTPGSTVAYTITITNTGQTSYTGATVTDPLAGVARRRRLRQRRGHHHRLGGLHQPGPDLDR